MSHLTPCGLAFLALVLLPLIAIPAIVTADLPAAPGAASVSDLSGRLKEAILDLQPDEALALLQAGARVPAGEPGDDDVMDKYSVNPPNVYGFGHKAYYDHVVDCIQNDKKHLVDGLEGRKSLELISAIYESIETGREVSLRFRPARCRLGYRNE